MSMSISLGGGWRLVQGDPEGQTQTDMPELDELAHFSHPLDFHFSTHTMQNWPRLLLEVWHYDNYGREEPYGYGTVHLPMSPGEHWVQCHCWRPKGTMRNELMQAFVGGGLQLRSLQMLDDVGQRARMETVAMGRVNLRLAVVTRHFDRFGILC